MNYWRVATASPSLKVGDVVYNKEQIVAMAGEAAERKVRIMAFPEMALTGYTAADLLGQGLLLDEVDVALQEMATFHSLGLVFPYDTKKKKDLADVMS